MNAQEAEETDDMRRCLRDANRAESVVTFLADRLPAFTWKTKIYRDGCYYAVGYLGGEGEDRWVSALVRRLELERVRVRTPSRVFDDPDEGYEILAAVRKTVEAQEFILRALPDFLESLD